jgi:hypothetical protein
MVSNPEKRMIMKAYVRGLLIATIALGATAVRAAPIIEDFNYTAGAPLSPQNGGTGMLGPWQTAYTFTIGSGSLSYPGTSSTGNRAVFTPDNYASSSATRELQMGSNGTTEWLSFLMNVSGNPSGMVTEMLFAPSSGNYLRIGKVSPADNVWGVLRNGDPEVLSNVPIVSNVTAMFVMRFDFNSDPAANDVVSIYVNPTTTTNPGTLLATFADNNFSSAWTTIQWGGYATVNPGAATASLDLIRGGSSYADVAPNVIAAVPEPATYTLLMAGLCLVGAATQRRKSQPPQA